MRKVHDRRAAERSPRPFLRTVAIAATGLMLLTSSYQSCFAQRGPSPNYEEDEGLSSAEMAGIVVGGVAGGAALLSLAGVSIFGGGGGGGQDNEAEEEAKARTLPSRLRKFSGVRLVPGATELKAGTTAAFDLRVRRKEDGKWYSATPRAETTIVLKGGDTAIVPQEGTKNVFCIPLNAPATADGKRVTVVGTFTPEGGAPLRAEAQIRVRTAGSLSANANFAR